MKNTKKENEQILNRLYDTARDYQFFKVNDRRKAEKIQRRLNILKAEAQSLGIKYDLTTILK
jgi:hypothetical protein